MPASAIDLCLAATVAADLGVESDDAVQRVVTAASRAIANYCGRTFEHEEDIVEYPPSHGRRLLVLDRAPILSIATVLEHGAELSATAYESVGPDAVAGMVRRKHGTWPSTQDREQLVVTDAPGAAQARPDILTVTYTAGWVTPGQKALAAELTVTLPEDVQEAAILAAVALYRRRGVDPNIASESIGDWSVSYRDPNSGKRLPIPAEAAALLAPYVRQVA